ncbi:DUF602-domain-containing protein [Hysterangium stoloniferum]|nr:DUF602-domain-containing protein [Hysterangium stoloniferum]
MGNDGGSIPDRRDLVRNKPKAEQADKHNQMIARWFFCALSKRPLQQPIVSCPLGKLYNKDAILEYLLNKSDVKTLRLTHNPAPISNTTDAEQRPQFACPLTLKEMIGTHPFVYLSTCGCVFSQAGLRAVSTSSGSTPPAHDATKDDFHEQKDICPQCSTKFSRSTDIVLLNPTSEEEDQMRERLEKFRTLQAASKPKKSKKRKIDEMPASEPAIKRSALEPSLKAPRTSTLQPAAPFTNSAVATSRVVSNALAVEEQRRKSSISDAVKSLYTPKDGIEKKETFMTRGTFTRYA